MTDKKVNEVTKTPTDAKFIINFKLTQATELRKEYYNNLNNKEYMNLIDVNDLFKKFF